MAEALFRVKNLFEMQRLTLNFSILSSLMGFFLFLIVLKLYQTILIFKCLKLCNKAQDCLVDITEMVFNFLYWRLHNFGLILHIFFLNLIDCIVCLIIVKKKAIL